jgi:hypothetical protein
LNNLVKLSFVAIALLAGFFLPDLFNNANQKQVNIDDYCLLSHTPCIQENVTMQLSEDFAHPLKVIKINANWSDAKPQQLLLTLDGLEMSMGKSKYILYKQANGSYQGDIILPICTQESMTWIGSLTDGTHSVLAAIRSKQ